MNATIQLENVPPASLAPAASREAASLPSLFSAPLPSSEYRTANSKSIATPPRLEILVSHSFKKSKHFLSATRIAFFAYANFLPGKAPFVKWPKINRKPEKLEPPVSYRKQRPGTQINRKLSQGPRFQFSLCPMALPLSFTCHSPLVTSHSISNRNSAGIRIPRNSQEKKDIPISNRNTNHLSFNHQVGLPNPYTQNPAIPTASGTPLPPQPPLPPLPPRTRMLLSGKRPFTSKANRNHPCPRLFCTRSIKGDF
jgi:hypothetical protein